METLLLHASRAEDLETAGSILRKGGLVGIPTETVYGLAANALDEQAVRRIFAAKGRPADNPLIVHICELSQWAPLVRELPESALALAKRFWPGPLTVILPKSDRVPAGTSGGLDTVAVRFPAHPAAQAVIRAAGVPLAAPSANRSGLPSPTTFADLRAHMEGRAEALLDGGDCGVGVESTVVSLAGDRPRLLRPGGVTPEELRAVLGELELDPAVLHRLEEGRRAPSPGMKYKHYAPRTALTLVDASPQGFANTVNKSGAVSLCFSEDIPLLKGNSVNYGSRYDSFEQARLLFSALHRLDSLGAESAFAHLPRKAGVGLAVYNRLLRAAGFQVLRPERPVLMGLTGPSGGGKSTVGRALREQDGWAVIDCDAISHRPGTYPALCVERLCAAFGEDLAPGGVLDRRELGRRALSTPAGKALLEEITFPYILEALWREVAAAAAGHSVVVLDAPTLFEAGLDRYCARILAVTAPRELLLARIRARDGLSLEQAETRLAAQPPNEFYVNRADWTVENAGGESGLAARLAPIVREMGETP